MNEEWIELLEKVRKAEDADAVLAFLHSVDGLGEDARWRILSASLERLEELEYVGFEDELLRQCTLRSGYEGHFVHSLLNRWLKQQPVRKRDDVISGLLGKLDDADTSVVENSLWTLVTVGFRAERLEQKFVALVTEPLAERMQIAALWGLVWMGYPDTEFLETLLIRLLDRHTEVPELLTRCGRVLRSRRLLPVYLELFERIPVTAQLPMFGSDPLTDLLYVLADTAEAHPDVTAGVWDSISARGGSLAQPLSFHGGILEKLDDARVPDYILQSLDPAPPEDFREGRYSSPHYHPYSMLKKLNGKSQLSGLHGALDRASASTRGRVLGALNLDATVDTQNTGPYQTGLSHLKDNCWEVVLRLNLEQTSEWIVEALANETGLFAAADLCRLAGYLRVTGAVDRLRGWIVQEGWDQKEGLHIALGLAALEALGNIGTPEAFAALTESRVSFAGRHADRSVADTTPRDYCDAFTACLMSQDAEKNAEALVVQLEKGPAEHPRCWIACAAALQDAARHKGVVLEPYSERLYALLGREDVVRSDSLHFLVAALSYFPQDNRAERLLLNWARSAERQAMDAITALAHWQRLQSHSDMLSKIGLSRDDAGVWRVSRPLDFREAFVVGLLFSHDQELFTPALCDLIEKGSYREAAQVMQMLTQENASPVILDALVERSYRLNQPFQSESDVLWALLRINPARFAHEFRHEATASWHAAAREALVYYGEDLENSDGADMMAAFLSDPVYLIRRAAARNLAKKDMGRLRAVADALAVAADPESKVRAVEAAVWLDDREAFADFQKRARQDREEKVRSAAREAERDRRRVELSRDYVSRILSTPNGEVLAAWHYGQALQEIGDDDTSHRLDEAMLEPELLPNKRAYLQHLRDKVTKEWQEWEKKRKYRLSE